MTCSRGFRGLACALFVLLAAGTSEVGKSGFGIGNALYSQYQNRAANFQFAYPSEWETLEWDASVALMDDGEAGAGATTVSLARTILPQTETLEALAKVLGERYPSSAFEKVNIAHLDGFMARAGEQLVIYLHDGPNRAFVVKIKLGVDEMAAEHVSRILASLKVKARPE